MVDKCKELVELERLRKIIDNIQEGIVVIQDGLIKYCNQRVIVFLGYTEKELLSSGIEEFMHPDDKTVVFEHHARRAAGLEAPDRYECRVKAKSGDFYWVEVSGRKIDWDGKSATLNMFIDISKRKEFETKLHLSDKRYEDIVSSSPVGVFRSTPEGRYQYINNRFAEMLGYDKEELFHKDFRIHALYVDPSARTAVTKKLAKNGELYNHRIQLKRKDGTQMWMSIFVKTVISENRLYFDGFTLDVTNEQLISLEHEHPKDRLQALWDIAKHANVTKDEINSLILEEIERSTRSYCSFFGVVDENDRSTIHHSWSKNALKNCSIASRPTHAAISDAGVWARPALDKKILIVNDYQSLSRSGGYPHGHIPLKRVLSAPILKDGKVIAVAAVANKKTDYTDEDAWQIQAFVSSALLLLEKKEQENHLIKSEAKFRALFDNAGEGIFLADSESNITDANHTAALILGYDSPNDLVGINAKDLIHPEDFQKRSTHDNIEMAKTNEVLRLERRYRRKDGSFVPVKITIKFIGNSGIHHVLFSDISERKSYEEALRTKIIALTKPSGDLSDITFDVLFDIEEMQKIQDDFANATGVASLITTPEGIPITKPSNFTCFCRDIVRNSPKGFENCCHSDSIIGTGYKQNPKVQKCLSGGLWDAGASIHVGGKHIANWLVGQVRDESCNEESIFHYAREIGVNGDELAAAFRKVPVMSERQFELIAKSLHTFARQLSLLAYQNVQQARLIEDKNIAREELLSFQAQLVEKQETLNLVMNMASIAPWQLDLKSRSFTFNDEFYDLYATNAKREGGYSMHAERYARSFVHPDEEQLVESTIADILATKEINYSQQFKHRIVRRDGQVRFIIVRFMLLRDEDGNPQRTIGANQDITEQVWLIDQLASREQSYKALVDGLPDAIMRFDADCKHIFVSKSVENYFSFPSSMFLGKTHRELGFPNEYCDYWEKAIQSVFGNKVVCEDEFSFKGSKQCTVFNWRLLPEFNDSGEVASVLSICRDITTHRRLEQDYKNLFDRMLDGFAVHEIICDDSGKPKDYKFLAVNHAFEQMVGLKRAEVVGKTVLELMPETEPYWIETYGKVALSGKPTYFENYAKEVDRYFEVAAYQPAANQFACVFVDVTEKKKYEEKLIHSKAVAEAASKAKSEFLANMSHEIRTPLNGMLGMLQLLETSELNQEQADYISKALFSGKRLTRLLTDILDVSAIEARKLTLAYAEVDIIRLIESVKSLLEITAQQKGIELKVEITPATPQLVISDEVRLRQILFNLAGNGLKFTQSGLVTIEVCYLEKPNFEKQHLLATVSDTGPGISDSHLDKAFEAFGQIAQGYTKEHQGPGLGLPIVKRIVELMGGTICVDSNGHGSTFYVSIPVERYKGGNPSHTDKNEDRVDIESTPAMKEHVKILLVEDDPSNSFALTRLLNKEGYEVQPVFEGKEAIGALKRGRFDVVLMDIQMPEMNGLEATQAIREGLAGGENRKIPIIALTAYAMTGDEDVFMKAGMDGYIDKPVKFEQLLSLISSTIAGN